MVTTSIAHGHGGTPKLFDCEGAPGVAKAGVAPSSWSHAQSARPRAGTVETARGCPNLTQGLYRPRTCHGMGRTGTRHQFVTCVGFTKKRPACSLIRSESESDARRSWFHPRRRVGNTSLPTTRTTIINEQSTPAPDYSRRALELDGDTCSPKGFSLARATGAASLAATPRSSAALRIGRSSRSTVRCTGAAHAAAGREAS